MHFKVATIQGAPFQGSRLGKVHCIYVHACIYVATDRHDHDSWGPD